MIITGPNKLVKRAQFVADILGINPRVDIKYKKGKKSYSQAFGDSFKIRIAKWAKKYPDQELLNIVGHEMIHVWQHVRGDLKDCFVDNSVIWKGQVHSMGSSYEEYMLLPWEIEARGLEEWIEWRWRNK